MPRRIETLFLPGPAGRLEALLEEPEADEPVKAALVCHPHPKGGGTMHNKVAYRIARGLRRTGCVVLRFNYRGVNLSEGTYDGGLGEAEDARVALETLRSRYPSLPLLLAGFSFGSRIALRLAGEERGLERVIAVGFPTTIPDHSYVEKVKIPKYFVQSTEDAFGPREEFSTFYEALSEPKYLEWIPASDHFFKDRLDDFEAAIERINRLPLPTFRNKL
ncbi:MAG: alpha/beta hydrolase [Bryobacteraceae bacterium]